MMTRPVWSHAWLTRCLIRGVSCVGCLGFALRVPAQVPEGSWVLSASHAEVQVFSPTFQALDFTGQSPSVITVDEDGFIYILRQNWYRFYRARWDGTASVGNRILIEQPGSTPALPVVVGGYMEICATRDRLWGIDVIGGACGSLSKTVNGQTMSFVGNVYASNPLGAVDITGACTDGRELFFATSGQTQPAQIWALDLRSGTATARLVTTFPASPIYIVLITMGSDGSLLAMGYDALYRVETRSGTRTWIAAKPADPDFSPSSGYGRILVAYDPWTDVVAIGPAWQVDTTNIYSRTVSGTAPFAPAYYFPFFSGLRRLVNGSEQPFEYFGKGCLNALGKEPRMGWQGLPLQGQSFTLKLRDAEPNGFAIFWVGGSDTFWPGFGALPFDASPLGAPGCRIHASSDLSYFVAVNASGEASQSIPVPQNSALHGFEVYAQTASTSGGNVLGLAASDAVVIRLR